MTMVCAVYRFVSAEGVLLYIGASSWPVDRISQHVWKRGNSMKQVSTIQVKWFESRAEARRHEVEAIKADRPLWNLASAHTGGGTP